MKNYLSIGEVSKIKGISHRMLRYYDKIGVLVPAFINEETGYRYYSKIQMIILDIILICIELGIPLNQLNNYILENGSYDIEKIVVDGEKLARKKLKQVNKTIYMLNSMKIQFSEDNDNCDNINTKYFDTRYFFTAPFDLTNFTLEDFWEQISLLYKDILENDLTVSINQGQCFYFDETTLTSLIYIEIAKPKKMYSNVIKVSSGNYECEFFEDENTATAIKKYSNKKYNNTLIILSDILKKQAGNEILPFEIQILKP